MRIYLAAIVGVFCLLALAGCAHVDHTSDFAARAKIEMVGMTKAQLLACAGEPEEKTNDGVEYWRYVIDKYVNGEYKYCQANFSFKRGLIDKLYYKTRYTELRDRLELCNILVQPCLAP